MAPTKRSVDKTASKVKDPQRKMKKKGGNKKMKDPRESFAPYIYQVLKMMHPEAKISAKAMDIMNHFMKDIFEKLAKEASRLVIISKKRTIRSREIQTATRLLLPPELARFAMKEGQKAVLKYTLSK